MSNFALKPDGQIALLNNDVGFDLDVSGSVEILLLNAHFMDGVDTRVVQRSLGVGHPLPKIRLGSRVGGIQPSLGIQFGQGVESFSNRGRPTWTSPRWMRARWILARMKIGLKASWIFQVYWVMIIVSSMTRVEGLPRVNVTPRVALGSMRCDRCWH